MSQLFSGWQWEPWLLACIALALVPYVIGMWRMDTQRARILGRLRAAAFFAGLVILLVALESPLDAVADDLFSVHMVQHMLLLLVIPPLLVHGRPVITWLWAFGVNERRTITRGWKRTGLDAAFRWLMRPVVVWVLLSAALIFWHLPGPYDAAVRHEWLHDLEHLSFLGFSLAFWTIVIEPYGARRRLGHGATIVFVVSAGFVMSLIGAILTLASHPFYPVHLHTTQAYGLTPLQDQQVAGIVMWIPSNLVHAAALCGVFLEWLRADQRHAAHADHPRRHAGVYLLLLLPLVAFLLGGCGRREPPDQMQARRGAQLIAHYGCGSCHTIPGINGADGLVGPPLAHWSRRTFIAGVLPNDPDNLALWIQHPQQVVPGVAMPDMGIQQQDARAIAAYLDTIR
ncbi:MAG TPA: cytochrome c oxidase assembly protein [Rhodanobacteraceae bacterium]|jgi:cytochrome c oxidase assembly factor CtaG/cytochrome c2|nr:cytochrome c oxidase assembly protein [Rhodanobacteraceae bacterium]